MAHVPGARAARLALPVAALVLLAACSTPHALTPSKPSGGGGATLTLGTVGSAGGTVRSASGDIELVVPAGALGGGVTVTASTPSKPPKGGLAPETTLGPDGTTFQQDATLTFTYDPASLPSGTNQPQLALAREVGGAWMMLPTSIDTGKHTLSAPVGGLGTYAVVDALHTVVGASIEQVRLLQSGAQASGGTDSLTGFSKADPPTPFQYGVAGGCSNFLQGLPEFPALAADQHRASGLAGTIQTPTGVVEQSQASNSLDLSMSPSRLAFSQGASAQTNPLQVLQWATASAGDDYAADPAGTTGYFFTVADPGGAALNLATSWTAAGAQGRQSADSGSRVTVDVYVDDGSSCAVTQDSGLLFDSAAANWNAGGSHTFHVAASSSGTDLFLYVYVWVGAYANADSTVASTSGPDASQAATTVTLALTNPSIAWTGY